MLSLSPENCPSTRVSRSSVSTLPLDSTARLLIFLSGYSDLPSRLPTQSSTLYSNNVTKFLLSIGGEGRFAINLEDEVVRGSIVLHNGNLLPPVPRPAPPPVAPPSAAKVAEAAEARALTPWQKASREVALITGGMGSVITLGKLTGPAFMSNFFTFGLAGLIGYRVVWGVAPALHSPLMSVTNAISGEKFRCVALAMTPRLILDLFRYGRCRRHVRHGWRIPPYDGSSGFGCRLRPACQCERRWWLCHYEAHARHVQA